MSRHRGARLVRWSLLALAGAAGGIALGDMAAGSRMGRGPGEPASYSHLSANPGALTARGGDAAPCPDCADSYGVAMRLRASRNDRMSDEFRELGTVEGDASPSYDMRDDYRYGGRFPDPEPQVAAASDGPRIITWAGENAPTDEMAAVPAN
ncbi:hypothetical protein [Sphingopyxis sp.]|uniref:hypothetical protein n=1 Tax=Sphingopyxis sp. TaxID=1908224 RepID=UPI002E0535E9|nr:hypothetical protein [Sphingopyxis sp.]